MATQNTSRRLTPQIIAQNVDSLNGLKAIPNYSTPRSGASLETLEQAYQVMLAQQQTETKQLALYRAAADAARLAEWEFHNTIIAMKEVIRGQFGSDSDEAQAVGLKKKSDRKRPTRQKATSEVS